MPSSSTQRSDRDQEEDQAAKRKDAAEAYTALLEKSRHEPDNAVHAFNAGLMAEKAGYTIAALDCYEQAVKAPGNRPRYWHSYGRLLRQVGDHERANFAFAKYANRQSRLDRPALKHRGGLLHYSVALRASALLRPEYGHSVYHAGLLAQALEIPRIRVAELGVASGRGLLALEEHAEIVTELTGVAIEVWGFDTGTGLPASDDPRDIQHFFSPGDYTMQDKEKLDGKLRSAELVIGDAVETVRDWIGEGPPIGAVMFDMDLYTSTKGVLDSMGSQADDGAFLPRTSLVFDDVTPRSTRFRLKDYSSLTGETAAIEEFDRQNESKVSIEQDRYFTSYPENLPWHHSCFTMHRLEHPQYRRPVRDSATNHLSLS